MNLFICNIYSKIYLKSVIFLCILILTAKVSTASEYKDNIDEYKAPSGGWKITHQWNVADKFYENQTIKAVSPTGKETLIRKWVHLWSVTWLNSHVAEIIETCGTPCKDMYFFDTEKGVSEIFLNVIAYSIKDNLIAYPSYNQKKNRAEIVISEIYTKKNKPVAVIYRKWNEISFDPDIKKAIIKKDSIYLKYERNDGEEVKINIFFKKEPPFTPCDDNSSKEVEYCSTVGDDYKKGYIWFAAEQPPVGMIDTPKESPLCYRFPAVSLDWQLQRLKDKYGAALYDEKIIKESDGSSSLAVKRKDESGKEIVYSYFDNPKLCAEYQAKRLGEMPPVPYYDYGGCEGECCQYATWTAKEKVILRKDHSDLSPAIATIEANEKVDAFTGVVITRTYLKKEEAK